MNNALKLAVDKGATMKMVAEDWEFLHVQEYMYVCMCIFLMVSNHVQIQVALLIIGDTPGIHRQMLGNKAVRGQYMYAYMYVCTNTRNQIVFTYV